ncbi:MAG: hypothetical protein HOQ44_14000 [Nocardia sp.]|nr:hypothetical protein [Nocardia sp.]
MTNECTLRAYRLRGKIRITDEDVNTDMSPLE